MPNILHPGGLFGSGERSQENSIFVAIVAYYEQIRFGSDLSRIKLKNGKQPFTKVVGHGGKGRVDRATWSLVTALTKQQAQRGQQAMFLTIQAALHAVVPFQLAPPLHQVPPNPPEALLDLGDDMEL